MKTTHTTITPARCAGAGIREHRFAIRGEELGGGVIGHGPAADLTVSITDRGGYRVSWSGNNGAGWGKRFGRSFTTEAEALAFATAKWPALLSWIETVAPRAARPIDAVYG